MDAMGRLHTAQFGMLISIRMTSGRSVPANSIASWPSACLRYHTDVGLICKQICYSLSNNSVIIGDHHPDLVSGIRVYR